MNFRSIIFCSLAVIASFFILSVPATAGPMHLGPDVLHVYAVHQDMAKAIDDICLAMDRVDAQREAAFFLNSDHSINLGAKASGVEVGLKPEYAESHATAGLSFIDLRRRC